MKLKSFVMKRFQLFFICLLAAVALHAQTTKQEVLDNPLSTRGQYSNYPVPTESLTPAPEGYSPVYLSHYGRHGSRYHTSRLNHINAYNTLKAADEANLLTQLGKSVYERVEKMNNDAVGRDGGLTDVGVEEHRGIAERMFYAYPELFNGSSLVDSRSTEAPRCILSMAANNERLRELNPNLNVHRAAFKGDEDILRMEKYQHDNLKDMGLAKAQLLKDVNPSEFIARVFKKGIADVLDKEQQVQFMRQMYALYQIVGCTSYVGVTFDDIFKPEELFVLWVANSAGNYAKSGNSKKHGKGVLNDAKPLLKDIVDRADAALNGNGTSADLRFGHDVIVAPLAALINLNGMGACVDPLDNAYKVWADYIVMPMATNIQFVFYRNKGNNVLVKVLYNEKESTLPGVKTVNGPYYDWKDVRNYFVGLL